MHPQDTPMQLALFPADKRCCHCKATKPLTEFGRSRHERDGLNRQCKECVRAGSLASYDRRHVRVRERCFSPLEREALAAKGQKRCARCKEPRPMQDFAQSSHTADGLYHYCRACSREDQRQRYHADPATARAQARAYYWKAPDVYRQRKRAVYAVRPEDMRLRNMVQYLKHRGKRRAAARQFRIAHADAIAAYQRAWRQRNPVTIRAKNRERDARKRAAPGRWTPQDVNLMRDAQRGRCAYCLVPLGETYHVEHMTPLSRGGSNWPWNLCVACDRCNSRKHVLCAGAFFALLLKEDRAQKRSYAAV